MSGEGEEAMNSGILVPDESVADQEYTVLRYINGGNSGEVYRLSHPKHGNNRVLKLFVPFYQLRQAQLGQEERGDLTRQIIEDAKRQPYQQREYRFLSNLDHPYIVKVHDFGIETLSPEQADRLRQMTGATTGAQVSLPYIVAAFVEGQSFAEGVGHLDRAGVLRVLRCVAEALDYLHLKHETLHLDIKSGNVRVRPDGYPILLDFALSQDLSGGAVDTAEPIKGGIDWDLTPFRRGTSGVADFIQRVQTDGMSKEEFKAEAFPAIDLYQFGLMMKESLDAIRSVLTPAEQLYLQQLIDTLVDWHEVRQYPAGNLLDLVRRIDATQFYLAIRPGSMSGGREMPLSNGRVVFVPPRLVPVVEHPELTRLNRLNQLSLLPARFSGATHSRYEHSLDVLRLAQSAARRLLDDPMCRRVFNEADVECFVVTALLHDINHLPLTHLYQESGLAVLKDRDLFLESLETRHLRVSPLGTTVAEALGQPVDRIHRLIEGSWEEQKSPADQIISSAINSGVDLDKLSYLRLDSERSGLGFAAGIDTSAIMRAMKVVEWEKRDGTGAYVGQGLHIAFAESELPLIESLVMARTRAFEHLYWCDDNRAMMAQFLACTRAIATTDDGLAQLAELMVEVRAETDYAVLRRLDELAQLAVGRSWQLSYMFDSIEEFRPSPIYAASHPWERLRHLGPNDRIAFEESLRGSLEEIAPALAAGPEQLMVDVPLRPLDIGGEILLTDRLGTVRRAADVSDVVRSQEKVLRSLAGRVRMFVSGQAAIEWSQYVLNHGQEEGEAHVGRLIEAALGRSSLR